MVDEYVVGENRHKAYMFTVYSLLTANADDKDSDIFYIAAEIGKEIDTHKKISSKRAILGENGVVK